MGDLVNGISEWTQGLKSDNKISEWIYSTNSETEIREHIHAEFQNLNRIQIQHIL